jgi:hypothetical protein
VRGEEPVVIEALKVGALFKGSNNPRCGVSGVALNAPKAYADPRSGEGERDEAMIIKQYESI